MDISEIMQLQLYPREITESIWKWMDDPRIIVLVGSRQVGKTSVLYLLIKQLIEQGVNKESIFYFDLEDFDLLNLFNSGVRDFLLYLEAQGMKPGQRYYVFVDEIQYMDDPNNFLKLIADHHRNLKFICSGSSTLEVRRKFKDSLAGRKVVFEVPTLSFREYLIFKGEEALLKALGTEKKTDEEYHLFLHERKLPLEIYKKQIYAHYEEYVVYGGYPAVAKEKERNKKLQLLQDIYESYVRKDINQLFTVENLTAFNNLVRLMALQIGNLVNLHEVTTSLSISRPTVEKYLFVLENTFILKLISPFFANKRKEVVKMPKVYFHDTGMRNQVIRNFQSLSMRPDAGALIENSIFSSLNNHLFNQDLKFWRTKNGNEVDFVIEGEQIIPVEVKYTTIDSPRLPSGISSFIREYRPGMAYVVTKDFSGNLSVKEETGNSEIVSVTFAPSYLLL
jgi:predicted AAA+ superfamily ATPase